MIKLFILSLCCIFIVHSAIRADIVPKVPVILYLIFKGIRRPLPILTLCWIS